MRYLRSSKHYPWRSYSTEQLLDMKFRDLKLSFEGCEVNSHIQKLYREIEHKGLVFRPHFWISDEWFCPDGVTGVALPFYLFHPRLCRLEEQMVFDVEGGTPEHCMKLLRHESGHALENAYALRRKKLRRDSFGSSSLPYPEDYTPRPYSKSFVVHLDGWYAQAHPDEDFAETFAVWLNPRSNWRKRYENWPALRKLSAMDQLMFEIRGQKPKVVNRTTVDSLTRSSMTLREHYRRKRERYGIIEEPTFFKQDLFRLFSNGHEFRQNPTAASFIKKHKKDIRKCVSRWTSQYQYIVEGVLDGIIQDCREHKLRLKYPEDQSKIDFVALLTVQTMTYLQEGHHRILM